MSYKSYFAGETRLLSGCGELPTADKCLMTFFKNLKDASEEGRKKERKEDDAYRHDIMDIRRAYPVKERHSMVPPI